ncbi:hypothetical protein FOLKNPGA_02628 [Legionella sp. PC1000]|nr:hypothetical protein FOLKNPGA_02628 [Legionella sp. PC1000]
MYEHHYFLNDKEVNKKERIILIRSFRESG